MYICIYLGYATFCNRVYAQRRFRERLKVFFFHALKKMLIWHCLQYKAIKKSTNRGNHVSKQHSAAFILLLFFRFLDLDSFRESFIFFQTWHRTLGPKSNCSSYLHLQFAIYWQVLYTGFLAPADFSGAVFIFMQFYQA